MRTKLIYLMLFTLAFTSCDVDSDWHDPNDPYEEYAGRMIERIRIEHNAYDSDYIYYEYDRRGRITSIENTYLGTIDYFNYGEDDYGDMITVSSNLGEDRDIYLDWEGYAESEVSFSGSNTEQRIEYSYIGDELSSLFVEEYNRAGDIVSEEDYDFDYDSWDNLERISRYYEEYDYYEDIELRFSAFSDYKNDYNIDLLSVIGLYIDDDYASQIGRTGERSEYLPTRAVESTNRNGRYDDDISYRISYTLSGKHITRIEVTSSHSATRTYHITYR